MEPRRWVAEQWEEYESATLEGASPEKRRELRRAFIAGTLAMFKVMLLPPVRPTVPQLARIDEILAEFREWEERLTKGEV